MDVVLIQPRQKLSREYARGSVLAALPLGLLAIATPLDLAGYTVRIIDQRLDGDWQHTLLAELKSKPICVGVTAMTGPQIFWALKASEIVKRHSDVPVVWGGIHASLLPEQTLSNRYVDIVVKDEGEETFLELVGALAAKRPLSAIKGIYYKESAVIKQNPARPFIDLNKQPLPAYHLVDVAKYYTRIAGTDCFMLETSRGCPFSCGFCYNTCFHHNQWRAQTAERVLESIRYVVGTYHVGGVGFRDDNFFTDPRRAEQILEGMLTINPRIVWGKGDIRLDTLDGLDNDYLDLLVKSRCLALSVGIESGSQRMADLMRKEIDISRVMPLNRRIRTFPIALYYLFLLGIPGETGEDLFKTAALMLSLVKENSRAATGVQIFVPYPGTELAALAEKNGYRLPDNLEGWISASWANRDLHYPWLGGETEKIIRMLHFCSIFLARDKTLTAWTGISPLMSLAAKIYSPMARYRVKGMHAGFLPELKAAEMLGFRGY